MNELHDKVVTKKITSAVSVSVQRIRKEPSEVIKEGSIYSECLLRDTSEGEFSLHEKFPASSLGISQVAIAAQTQNTSVRANKELQLNCSWLLYQCVHGAGNWTIEHGQFAELQLGDAQNLQT